MRSSALFFALVLAPVGSALAAPPAADLPSRAVAILTDRCTECHDDLARSGLDVTSRALILKGGKKGPAVIPGSPDASLLYRMVSGAAEPKMPPGKETLTPAEVATLRAWIAGGASWPTGAQEVKVDKTPKWWSFRPPVRPAVPAVKDPWVRTPVDAFVLVKLREKGLAPSPEADRTTLIRRATYDLHGLPPTRAEIDAFLADTAPDAYEKLIERLLASPRYGEKWGRNWLDLVRYGDTSGFEQDPYLLDAWRFRDYVITAFNEDKPFDRFIKEQLAGDEFFPDDPVARAGTGYYTVGPNRDMLFKVEDTNRIETLTDFVDTTSAVFMGLSMGCARCHDHKFDPLLQRDYFRMQAIFVPLVKTRVFLDYNAVRGWDVEANYREFTLREIGSQLAHLLEPHRHKLGEARKASLPADLRAALAMPEEKRTAHDRDLVVEAQKRMKVSDDDVRAAMSPDERKALTGIERQLVAMFTGHEAAKQAPAVMDQGPEGLPAFMPVRGKSGPGEPVWPGLPSAFGGAEIPAAPLDAPSTGRRRALAEWLTRPDHPLTARVYVNRLWHFHFGKGIVATPSEFGRKGLPPTHPELLDWLATELPARGWSTKAMHRLLMTSSVYRQSSLPTPQAQKADPDNQWLGRMNRRRLAAEEIRDSVLATAGTLNLKMGGRPIVPPLPSEELYGLSVPIDKAWVVTADARQHTRRSVYMLQRRGFRPPMMEAFDTPDGILTCPRRESSTASPQALTLLNGRFTIEQARALSQAVLADVGVTKAKRPPAVSDAALVRAAWLRLFGREPGADEATLATTFLARQRGATGNLDKAVTELGRALWNSNAFLYVD